ncbi:acetyl-CoA carboxylase biotin carboxyl carrier protein, partial [Klebsiella pneumoniae]
MDIASIEKLIALVEASGIGELEIAEGASSVRISRAISSPTAVGSSAVSAAVVQPQ